MPRGSTPWPTRATPDEWLYLTGVLLVVALVYLPTLAFGWVYDDAWTILNNGYLRADGELWRLLHPSGRARQIPDVFRPTLVLVDRASYHRMGLDPRQHHALSVALHLAVCWLGHRLLVKWGAPLELRLGATALYGVMALHAEAVTVVSFREDLLAAALGLAALLVADVGARALHRRWWLALPVAAALSALACGAKLSAAPLPLLLALVHALDPWRADDHDELPPHRSRAAVFALTVGVGLALAQRALVLGGLDSGELATTTGRASAADALQIHLGYLGQMVLPLGLSPEYDPPPGLATRPWLVAGLAAGALGLAGALGYALWGAWGRRRPVAAFAVLGTALLMLPTSHLIPLDNLRADRFMYLPSWPAAVGLAALALPLGDAIARRWVPGDPLVRRGLVLALVVVQGASAMAASRSYGSNTTLWKVAGARAPASARAQAMLGLTVLGQRDPRERDDPRVLAEARAHCLNARRLDPEHPHTQVCAARVALEQRHWSAAQTHYAQAMVAGEAHQDRVLAAQIEVSIDAALEARPGADPALGLGAPGASRAAALDAAWPLIREGLARYPYSPLVHASAGRVFHRLGYPHAARYLYDRSRRLDPERWQTAAWELELALDEGDRARARGLRGHDGRLRGVDEVARRGLEARFAAHRRGFVRPWVQVGLDFLVQSRPTGAPPGARRP